MSWSTRRCVRRAIRALTAAQASPQNEPVVLGAASRSLRRLGGRTPVVAMISSSSSSGMGARDGRATSSRPYWSRFHGPSAAPTPPRRSFAQSSQLRHVSFLTRIRRRAAPHSSNRTETPLASRSHLLYSMTPRLIVALCLALAARAATTNTTFDDTDPRITYSGACVRMWRAGILTLSPLYLQEPGTRGFRASSMRTGRLRLVCTLYGGLGRTVELRRAQDKPAASTSSRPARPRSSSPRR